MDKIKSALTRKFGPLPAWAWLGILGVGYYYYRNRTSAASGTGTGAVAPAPPTPQPGQLLDPGQSYYDPNTGGLVTAPTPGGSSNGSSGNTSAPGSTSNPPATGNGQTGNTAAWKAWFNKRYLRRRPKQWQKLWVKRHPNARKRPNATINTRSGGRTTARTKSSGVTRGRSRASLLMAIPAGSGISNNPASMHRRPRPKTPIQREVIRQHPVAATRPSAQPEPRPAPRPSVRRSSEKKRRKK